MERLETRDENWREPRKQRQDLTARRREEVRRSSSNSENWRSIGYRGNSGSRETASAQYRVADAAGRRADHRLGTIRMNPAKGKYKRQVCPPQPLPTGKR